MDDDRFDSITRRLAAGASRRDVLRKLAGGALGGTLAVAGLRRSGAAPAGKVGICHNTGSASNPLVYIEVSENAVPAHAAHGDAIGVDLQTDEQNCGTCGNVCLGDACNTPVCTDGVCGTEAVVCEDTNPCTDNFCDADLGGCQTVNNTAACTTATGQAGTCNAGACVPNSTCPGGQACGLGTSCGTSPSGASCACGTTTEGTGFCFTGAQCPTQVCTSSAQCGGGACVVVSPCCGSVGPAGCFEQARACSATTATSVVATAREGGETLLDGVDAADK